jgi:hypothetical protein
VNHRRPIATFPSIQIYILSKDIISHTKIWLLAAVPISSSNQLYDKEHVDKNVPMGSQRVGASSNRNIYVRIR